LDKIVEHAGLLDAPRFNPEALNTVTGFNGSYNTSKLTADDHVALKLLREHFRKDQEDLKALVDMLYPDSNFTVQLESE
jgi:hypothetical protein